MKNHTLLFSALIFGFCAATLLAHAKPDEKTKTRKFELYDAMGYAGKPTDLSSEGFMRLRLIYEGDLTRCDPENEFSVILDPDKIRTFVESAQYSGLHMINTDIEHWYYDDTDDEGLLKNFAALFDAFRDEIPGVQIANYGIPVSALCVFRFYNSDKMDEKTLLEKWWEDGEKRILVASQCDYLSPSVYIAQPDIESWISDLKYTVGKIRAFEPDKKLLVYIWPSYYNKPQSPYYKKFVTPEVWERMLEATYETCDGAIIWSTSRDEDESIITWTDPRVEAIMDVTRRFIARHADNMATQPPLPPLEPLRFSPNKPFDMYYAFSYSAMPDLGLYGFRPLKMVAESELVSGPPNDKIGQPDSVKIARFAADVQRDIPGVPVVVRQQTWIKDRQSNHPAMLERFARVQRIFKSQNTQNKLGFTDVSPMSIEPLRRNNPDFIANVDPWLRSNAMPLRALRQYTDIILPSGGIIDDDVEAWERNFRVMVREARYGNPDQPVYVWLPTHYNDTTKLQPIESGTFYRMLNVIYALCDGVILVSNPPLDDPQTKWDDASGFWKGTQAFLKRHRLVAVD